MAVAVVINGRTQPPSEAKISVFDRGLLYGDSVFETLGTYGGRPFALDEHLTRLRRSAGLVHIDPGVSDDIIERDVAQGLEAAGNRESYVRVIVTRGSGEMGLDPALAVAPQRIVIVTPLTRPSAETYEKGVAAVTHRSSRATDASDAVGAKVGNYLVAVLAMQKAHAVQANEALIVDREGQLVEGATSNLFWTQGEVLWTPPESAGILAGITRRVVIDAAGELGIPVEYRCLRFDELGTVDELFITSSIRQMLSVVIVDGKPVGAGRPGPIYRRLFEKFREIVRRS